MHGTTDSGTTASAKAGTYRAMCKQAFERAGAMEPIPTDATLVLTLPSLSAPSDAAVVVRFVPAGTPAGPISLPAPVAMKAGSRVDVDLTSTIPFDVHVDATACGMTSWWLPLTPLKKGERSLLDLSAVLER